MLTVIPFDGALNNDPGCVVDVPLIDGGSGPGMCLTSDTWAHLRQQRAQAGRPLNWWEIPAQAMG